MSTTTRIDVARPADIPQLTALLAQLFSIEQDFAPDNSRQQRGLRLLLEDTARSHIAVARDAEGRVVAMATVQLVISTAEGAPSAWIEDVVVSPGFRRQGLARALLQALLDWASAHHATRAQLLVDLDNTPALDFYQHLGWQATKLGARRLLLHK